MESRARRARPQKSSRGGGWGLRTKIRTVHPEIEQQRDRIKEILYDCAVEVRATKAALYVVNGDEKYELVSEYGFRATARQSLDLSDPIIDRCEHGGAAFFINGFNSEPRFSERLYEAGTDRLLAVPIWHRGQLVGVIDMRDKQQKAQFEPGDVTRGVQIADRLGSFLASRNVFGNGREKTTSDTLDEQAAEFDDLMNAQRLATLARTPLPGYVQRASPPQTRVAAAPPIAPPPPEPKAAPREVPRLSKVVLDAREIVANRVRLPSPPETLTEHELAAARDVLRIVLALPGVVIASFTAFGHLGGVQEVVAKANVTDEAMNLFDMKLKQWMRKRGENPGPLRANIQAPLAATGAAVRPHQLVKVLTAPVAVGAMAGLSLTVAFESVPDRQAHELLAAIHSQLQIAIEQSIARGTLQSFRARAAAALVEPDFVRYPALRRHSDEVTARAEELGKFLALTAGEIEAVRLTAMLHDVGMRLLEYDRLYRRRDITNDELSILREHPSVGAALVEPVFGAEIARYVLCHHERIDGRGYPHELQGDEIPLVSRIVQICDAYEAMVSADSYQPPQTRNAAMSTLALGAGTQFDRELVQRFQEMMRAR